MKTPPTQPKPPTLEQLLQRSDIWRGQGQRSKARNVVDSGHPELNRQLLDQGWPTASLIEICQPAAGHGDWLLFTPALKACLQAQQYAILLNPPALPFAQGLKQNDIPVEQLLIVRARNKTDFISSFIELARARSCGLVLAWQPQQALSYSELRKCQLATSDGQGLYILFRSSQAIQQSSPAALRLIAALDKQTLNVTLLKQRGQLRQQSKPLGLPLPKHWRPQPPHRLLGGKPRNSAPSAANDWLLTSYQPRQNILSIPAGKQAKLKRQYS